MKTTYTSASTSTEEPLEKITVGFSVITDLRNMSSVPSTTLHDPQWASPEPLTTMISTVESTPPTTTCSPPSITGLWSANVTGVSFSVSWTSQSQTNQTYQVIVQRGSKVIHFLGTSETVMEVQRLQPGAVYRVTVTPCACGSQGGTSFILVKTDAQTLDATARLTNIEFSADLLDTSSQAYRNLTESLTEELYQSLPAEVKAMVNSGQVIIEIRGFSPGSVMVNLTLIFTTSQKQDIMNVSTDVMNSLLKSVKYKVDINNTSITDFDECASGENDCSQWATCTNTWASYKCACPSGFEDRDTERPGRACQAIPKMASITTSITPATSSTASTAPFSPTTQTSEPAMISATTTPETATVVPPTIKVVTLGTLVLTDPDMSTVVPIMIPTQASTTAIATTTTVHATAAGVAEVSINPSTTSAPRTSMFVPTMNTLAPASTSTSLPAPTTPVHGPTRPAPAPTTLASTTTSAPTTPASITTSAHTTPASITTSAHTTPASITTSAPTTPASTTTSAPTTPASITTSAHTTPASTTTSAPTTPASITTSAHTTPASITTSAPTTPASTTTSAPTTPASITTSAPTTPASTTTSASSTPASTTTSAPSTPTSATTSASASTTLEPTTTTLYTTTTSASITTNLTPVKTSLVTTMPIPTPTTTSAADVLTTVAFTTTIPVPTTASSATSTSAPALKTSAPTPTPITSALAPTTPAWTATIPVLLNTTSALKTSEVATTTTLKSNTTTLNKITTSAPTPAPSTTSDAQIRTTTSLITPFPVTRTTKFLKTTSTKPKTSKASPVRNGPQTTMSVLPPIPSFPTTTHSTSTTAPTTHTTVLGTATYKSMLGAISVQCRVAAITVAVARDFLLRANIDEATLYLGHPECRFSGGNDTHAELTVGWNECVTRLVHNETFYTASVTLFNSIDPAIGEEKMPKIRLEVPIMCTFMKSMLISADFGPMGYDMIKDVIVGSGSFQVTVQLMNGTIPLPHNYSLSPKEDLVVEVSLNTSSEQIKVVINKCWATPTKNPRDTYSHTFLEKSCSLNTFTKVLVNGNSSTSRVSVKIFSIVNLSMIYLHCQVQICVQIGSDTCVPDCLQRTAQSLNTIGTAFGSSGPVLRSDEGSVEEEFNTFYVVGLACLGIGVSLFFIIGFICLFYYQRNRIGHYNFSVKPKQENFTYLVFNT
ncbi:uromodulin-like 1 isoform X3 [Xyrichtys novacula]|uniref:Uromodulin-like 1 isoform X3 n=1 Tax=Xyrichtys novacula TaxID=13765 RepID=A0AAV1FUS4_XYRNO|nr:uromodulin-like 1 isoform X3 [Xyrichtys novacula]